MKKLPASAVLTMLFLFFLISPAIAAQEVFPVKKQPELQQIKLKKPVKIRLKRTAEDEIQLGAKR